MADRPVIMPQLGEAVASGTIRTWLVAEGASVVADQPIAEVETEKAVLEIMAPASGVVSRLIAAEGETITVGDPVATIHDGSADTAPAQKARPAPSVRPDPRPASPEQTPVVQAHHGAAGFLSPKVRDLLAQNALGAEDLLGFAGTGAGGRITAADVERLVQMANDPAAVPASAVRRAVAGAMLRSWQRPLATVAASVDLEAVLAHRRGVAGRPSLTVYALRALALALKSEPDCARRLLGGRLIPPSRIHLAVAVEVDDGVLAPVIADADSYDLPGLAARSDTVIANARSGRLDHGGSAVATVSNYGALGIDWATPLPQPEQNLIMGLGVPRRQPVWDSAAKIWGCARGCEMTLTFDHRVADGAAAGRLLARLIHLLHHPEEL